jgi:glycosyltransferase involved in cell wall biosynthesis
MNDFSTLHLSSWYPTSLKPHHGIFIKNHILSASQCTSQIIGYTFFSETSSSSVKHNMPSFEEYLFCLKKNRIFFIGRFINLIRWIRSYRKFILHQIKNRPDIRLIHIHVVFPVSIAYFFIPEIRKYPLIITEHWSGYLPEDGNFRGLIRKFFTKRIFCKASRVLVCSERLGNRLKELKLISSFYFLENVVPDYFFQTDIPKHFPSDTESIHFIHVSSLCEREKNITGMLKALSVIKQKKLYPFTLRIIGGTKEDVLRYQPLLAEWNLEKEVSFLGTIKNENLPPLYAQSDFLLLFSHFESQPVVALEALATGVKVLCTPVGQLKEWIKDEKGACSFSHELSDIIALLEKAPLLKKKYPDRTMLRQWVFERFSSQAVGKKIFSHYQELILSEG